MLARGVGLGAVACGTDDTTGVATTRDLFDPTEESGTKTFERTFQFDLELREPLEQVYVGGRVFVRFDHGSAPFATQWYRALRQLFLRRFNI